MYSMKQDLLFIRKKFRENYKQFKKHLDHFDTIEDFNSIWSNSFLDFFPYESILEGYNQPVIYKAQPYLNDYVVLNQSINDNIFYAYKYLHKEWGSVFYINNEGDNVIKLYYDNQNEDDKMLLSQITYKIVSSNYIQKVLFYMFDKDMEEETFYIYDFLYDREIVNQIIRYDYFNKKDDMILYRFEYKDGELFNIWEKKVNIKLADKEKLIYKRKGK